MPQVFYSYIFKSLKQAIIWDFGVLIIFMVLGAAYVTWYFGLKIVLKPQGKKTIIKEVHLKSLRYLILKGDLERVHYL